MARVVVTGGTGFIGRTLVRQLLSDGCDVVIPTRDPSRASDMAGPNVQLVQCDLSQPRSAAKLLDGVDQIYHLAGWISTRGRDSKRVHESNYLPTKHLLEALEGADSVTRMVYLASIFALGGDSATPVDEDTDFNLGRWNIPYFRSKRAATLLVNDAVAKGAPIVSIYPTFCLGPGDTAESSAKVLLMYLRLRLPGYPAGGINVVHVEDAARGLRLGMSRAEAGESYIVGGDNLSWRELYRMAAREAGLRSPRLKLPSGAIRSFGRLAERMNMRVLDAGAAKMLTTHWYYDDSRARRELAYESRSAHQTVRESVAWYRESGKLRSRSHGAGWQRSQEHSHRVTRNG